MTTVAEALAAARATCPALHARLAALDPAQQAAVVCAERATLVHAQVGSGKTTVLVHRAAYLHAVRGVPLARIALLTFTTRAAAELRARLDAALGRATSARERPLVGTFHGVACALLRQALPIEQLGYTRGFTILDDDAAAALAVAAARRLKIRAGRRATLRDRLARDPALAEVAAEAAAARRARDAMDFDELLAHATALLPAAPHAGPAHVLVDEVQDCEPRDLAFLRALAGRDADFFAVGDPAQTIYGWRGSRPELMARAAAELGCQTRALPHSYRSTRTILEGARAILGEQPGASGELAPVRPHGELLTILRHHDPLAEGAYLAARLTELHATGVPWRDLAVLCRLRVQVTDLAAALTAGGVPCVHAAELIVDGADPTPLDGELDTSAPDAVRVSTIHAAKGLEFARVFLAGANVGLLPLHVADEDTNVAEERRLLYVALTRAREAVEISYQARPYHHHALGVPSHLLAPLPASVLGRDERRSMFAPPAPAPVVAAASGWCVGQRVRHARYGTGTITALGADAIDCDFGKLGPRVFPRALCPLVGAH